MPNKYKIIFLVITITISIISYRILTFEHFQSERHLFVKFEHNEDHLEGTLLLPKKNISPDAIVILIHGDGPQDRWSNNGYIPLVNHLLSKNIGVLSWDKAGIGSSTGNWLSQSMDDRADESISAYNYLKQIKEINNIPVGFLGFSQAGWVIPKITTKIKPDFSIIIGAAVNWHDQGNYFTRQKLRINGMTEDQITQVILDEGKIEQQELLSYRAIISCKENCSRKDFELKNALSDSKKEIPFIDTPIMILMGQEDQNVDPNETISIWKSSLSKDTLQCLGIVSKATHGLLRNSLFDYQLESQWPLWKQVLFIVLAKYAYAPSSLDYLTEWILKRKCSV